METEVPNGDALSGMDHVMEHPPQDQLIPPEELTSSRVEVLSGKQLLLHRGLAVALAVAVLVAGVLIRLLLQNG